MFQTNNLTQNDETKAVIDRSMLIAAYRYQIRTVRDRLQSLSGSDCEPLSCVLTALDEAEDYLTLYLDQQTDNVAA
jgi:hypothetical protein